MREKLEGRHMEEGQKASPAFACPALLACLTCLALLVGCGYQFRVEGAGPTIGNATAPPSSTSPPPRLVIRTLENKSFEPNLETRYTNYLRHEFSSGSGAQVVSESDAADLVLSGQILSVIVPSLSFTQTTTLESRTEVVVIVKVEETRTQRLVWAETAKGASEFFVTCSSIAPCRTGPWNRPVVSSPRTWRPDFCSSWNRDSWQSRPRVQHRTTRTPTSNKSDIQYALRYFSCPT